MSARLAAVGFIVVILSGNAWFVFALMGKAVPGAVSYGFALGIAVALTGGAGLVVMTVKRQLAAPAAAAESSESDE